ncbi:MAG: hypothetical protein ABWJ97_03345 [Thermoproteus sp.]
MSAKGALVYALSAVSILVGVLIVLNDIYLMSYLQSDVLLRDMALAAVGFVVGVIAPILYRKYSS